MTQLRAYNAWMHTLTLCAVKPGENVIIINSWNRSQPYKDVAALVCEQLGASVTYVEVADPNKLPSGIVPMLNAADFILDLVFVHDPKLYAAREHGTRILVVLEPLEVLERLLPQPADKVRALEAVAMVRASKQFHITSEAGTDFKFEIGQYRVNSQYGFSDEPGKWDQWPGVFVNTYANDASGNGRVVLDRGDMVFPFNRYFSEQVILDIQNGWITDISGGYEAEMLLAHMNSYGSEDVFGISHLGWGLTNNARWEFAGLYPPGALEGQDARGFAGNFLFSTGPNVNGGGTRNTPCHLDMPMRACTIALDGEVIINNGRIVYGEAPRAAAE